MLGAAAPNQTIGAAGTPTAGSTGSTASIASILQAGGGIANVESNVAKSVAASPIQTTTAIRAAAATDSANLATTLSKMNPATQTSTGQSNGSGNTQVTQPVTTSTTDTTNPGGSQQPATGGNGSGSSSTSSPNLTYVTTKGGVGLYYNQANGSYSSDSAGKNPVNYDSNSGNVTVTNTDGTTSPYQPIAGTTYKVDDNGNLLDNTGKQVTDSSYTKVQNEDGSVSYKDANGNVVASQTTAETVQPGDSPQVTQLKQAAEAQLVQANQLYQSFVGQVNTSTANLIAGITSMYTARIGLLTDAATRTLAGATQAGYRNGNNQYMPGIAAALQNSIEVEGQMKISSLVGDMNTAIAKAQQAQDDEDYKALSENMTQVKSIQSSLQTAVQDQYTLAEKTNADLVTAQNDAFNQAAKVGTQIDTEAKAFAPEVATALSGLSTDSDKQTFIDNIVSARQKSNGWTDAQAAQYKDSLEGAVATATQTQEKNDAVIAKDRQSTGGQVKDGSTTFSGSDISQIASILQSGADPSGNIPASNPGGKANTASYSLAAQNWLKQGGTLAGFLKQFPPEVYASTTDPTLPSYLAPKASSTGGNGGTTHNYGG